MDYHLRDWAISNIVHVIEEEIERVIRREEKKKREYLKDEQIKTT